MTEHRPSKGYKGIAMTGPLASWYAGIRVKDLAEIRNEAARLTRFVPDGGKVLEIAPGPGYMAIELARLGRYDITGVDISESFVRMAAANARAAGVTVDFRPGNASDLPLPGDTFDLTYCVAAFKNFSEPVRAISEMHRVLRPGGKAVILDMKPDVSDEAIDQYARSSDRGFLDFLSMKLTFKYFLSRRAHSEVEFRAMAAQTPFGTCEVNDDPTGIGLEVVFAKQLSE